MAICRLPWSSFLQSFSPVIGDLRSIASRGQEAGTNKLKVYGLPPAMAIDFASSYLLNKARLNLADQQLEKMQNQAKPSDLEQRLADFLKKAEEDSKNKPEVED